MKTIGIVVGLIVGSLTVPVAAAEENADEAVHFGWLMSFEGEKIVITPVPRTAKKLPRKTLDLSPDVNLFFNGSPGKRDDFATGNRCLIRYRLNSEMKVVEIYQTISVGGFLKSVEGGKVVVATGGGDSLEKSRIIRSFIVTKDTRVQIDQEDAKLTDFKPGVMTMCFIDKTGKVLSLVYQFHRTEKPPESKNRLP